MNNPTAALSLTAQKIALTYKRFFIFCLATQERKK
jgi:hypothetical protein